MGKLFDMLAERAKRVLVPDPDFIRKGADGQNELCFIAFYYHEGVSHEIEVWARDQAEAEVHCESMRKMRIRGQLLRTKDQAPY